MLRDHIFHARVPGERIRRAALLAQAASLERRTRPLGKIAMFEQASEEDATKARAEFD
jgi:hypothetical protein